MKNARLIAAACAALASLSTIALADDDHDRGRFPQNATFTTQAITPLAIEGLTADDAGNVYTTGRATPPALCPVWQITGAALTVVGFVPNPAASPCNPSGIAFDSHGDLYVADAASGGVVWRLTPNAATPPTATAFATSVPGTNGLAFDADGNLWTGDGTTGNGRVWKIGPAGGACEGTFSGCVEAFRIQPMANVLDPATSGGVANVGRDVRDLPPGTINAARAATPQLTAPPCPVGGAPCVLGSQPLVANGVAFTRQGDLYVADTARGAIWKIEFDRRGNLKNKTGCDTTFTANTLCLDSVFVAHPFLEGTDGIALDRAGNIWNSANERNAIVVVTKDRDVVEVFRNPVNALGLRNSADAAVGNNHILEFPTSPVLVGRKFCTSQSDGDRRDNSPRAAGEVNGGAGNARGKISCMDQALEIPGLPLPVR
ncbi:MAG TPA: SMP-30/gluconolactonase/LRE family protein [Burkholderiales bacterium]|jgi:sugar lactone lactonase YvrE|nr:SMP-30/gluconolactonase/LRE family protein [Burkholderiales bacterium]